MAAEGNAVVQLVLPMAETLSWLRQGVNQLVWQSGVQLMQLMMDEEVRALVGERNQPNAERTANRWGTEQGYCVVMGQKMPLQRPRVRRLEEDKEVLLTAIEDLDSCCMQWRGELRSDLLRVHRMAHTVVNGSALTEPPGPETLPE